MNKILILVIYFSFYIVANTQNIQSYLANYLKDNLPEDTKCGVTIFDLSNEKIIFQENGDELLTPASTTKLYTTGCALLLLGYDYKLTTRISTDDLKIEDGIIDGNIYLKGEGNPKLTSSEINQMIKSIKELGIYKITGDIIVDDSFFDEVLLRDHWIEDEGTNTPLPPISAVTVDYNTATIKIFGNKTQNKKPQVNINSDLEYFKIVNKVRITGNKININISSQESESGEVLTLTGTISKKRSVIQKVLIKNPANYIGSIIKHYLSTNEIQFKGKVLKKKSPKFTKILSVNEIPLIEIINEINKRSNNFLAEHLFKIIGGKYSGNDGGAYEASQSIFTLLKSNNLYEKEMSLVDGSGISRKNNFSTNAMVKLLSFLYYSKEEFEPFYNSLGIAGIDGTIRGRMKNSLAENNCHAKTGTLNGVVSLAGYVQSKSKRMIAFSINFNFTQKYSDYYRDLSDKIVEMLASFD